MKLLQLIWFTCYTACSINTPILGVPIADSEVKCLRVIERKSKQRAEYLQKQDDILSQQNKAKARAHRPIPKRRRPLYATATRPIPKRRIRDSYKADPERRRPLYATATIPIRRRPLYATATTQILNLSNLLKGSDYVEENRAAKRRNTRTIQLPLRHLKGIGIG